MDQDFVRKFYDQGYILVQNLFKTDEINEIRLAFERLQERAKSVKDTTIINGTQFVVEGNKIHRIVWTPGCEPKLGIYGRDSRIISRVSKILGSNYLDHLICQAHFKIPGDGIAFAWHQDSENRGYGSGDWRDVDGRGSYVQTIVAIDEMSIDNSPLKIIPFSHKKGHLALDQGDNRERLVNTSELIPVLMNPGDALFFSPYLIHGSEVNYSNKPRRIFINGFSLPEANSKVYPGEGAGMRIQVPPQATN